MSFTTPSGVVVATLGFDGASTTFDFFGGATGSVNGVRFLASATGGQIQTLDRAAPRRSP